MLYELLEKHWGSPWCARQPPSAAQTRPTTLCSETLAHQPSVCSGGPGALPGCFWLLRLLLGRPGNAQGTPGSHPARRRLSQPRPTTLFMKRRWLSVARGLELPLAASGCSGCSGDALGKPTARQAASERVPD